MEVITQTIGTLGFPIATSIALGWYIVKMEAKSNETLNKLTEQIANNTNVINRLIDILNRKDVIDDGK